MTQGWYANMEGERLVWMAQHMPNDLMVELGTAWGLSASYVLAGTDARLVCIDTWPDASVLGDFSQMLAEEDWVARVRVIQRTSEEAARGWDEPIGLLHIDASHGYEDVLADYRSWSPHVAEGGWVAFHDSQTEGVGRVLREEVWPDPRWTERQLVHSQWSARNG